MCYQENSTQNLPLNVLPAGSSFELEICSVQKGGFEPKSPTALVWFGRGGLGPCWLSVCIASMISKHPWSRGTQVPSWQGLRERSPARHVCWSACAVGQTPLLVCACCGSGTSPGLHVPPVAGSRAAAPQLVMTLYSSTLGESKGQSLAPHAMLGLQQFYV